MDDLCEFKKHFAYKEIKSNLNDERYKRVILTIQTNLYSDIESFSDRNTEVAINQKSFLSL